MVTSFCIHACCIQILWLKNALSCLLRYGWFEPDFEQQSHEPNLQDVHSVDKIIDNKPLDPVLMEQKQTIHLSEFPNDFAAQSVGDNAVQTVVSIRSFFFPSITNGIFTCDLTFFTCFLKQGNQSKVTPLSWIDCISNISFEELLSEAAPSADNKQLLSQNNTSFSQIPINFDSFDAAIASVIGQQQASNQMKVSNPSLWDAEEACHAFPLQSQTSIRTFGSGPNHSGAITSSILGTIPECVTDVDQVPP